jgi:hypothetical protein
MCATIVRSSAMRRPAALFVYSRDRAAEQQGAAVALEMQRFESCRPNRPVSL